LVAATWKDSARAFFDQRARAIGRRPTLQELCFVSGRDARLWADADLLDDLAGSILSQTGSTPSTRLLEVGCAAGFITRLLAPRVGRYTGVDVSRGAIRAAQSLGLPNADFQVAAGAALPFPDASFDTAICYDVVTNFPGFDDIAAITRDMLRVVKPGGKVMIGSVADSSRQAAFEARAVEVGQDLERRFGPPSNPPPPAEGWMAKLLPRRRPDDGVTPSIVCYYFDRQSFTDLAGQLAVPVELLDIHPRNPYAGFRFNAVFTKP
jgi:SAM-dependent methyltransferase